MTIDTAAGKDDSPILVNEADQLVKVGIEGGPKKNESGKFRAEMMGGKYLQILETYAVTWPTEKVARDVLQNFFDGSGGTLDGVNIVVEENDNGDTIVRIEGASQYDYRKLVHLGGSSKTNSDSDVGGFGEGAKIMSLVMLRDMGIEDVTFGSGDWQLKFYLSDVDQESYDLKVRGLFAKLEEKSPPINGNFFEFTIPKNNSKKQEYLEVFGHISDLFKHSGNPDFQNPIFENEDFGIVFLGNRNGNYYDGGQRRHVNESKWQTVEGFNIWSNKPIFKKDRDRGIVSEYDLTNQLLRPMFGKLKNEEVSGMLFSLREIWIARSKFLWDMKISVLSSLVGVLRVRGVKLDFGDAYYCDDSDGKMEDFVRSLANKGYIICDKCFKDIGMRTVSGEIRKNQKHYAKEVDNNGQARIDLLMNVAEKVLSGNIQLSDQLLPVKPILVFDRKDEGSIIAGEYNPDFTWMSEEILGGSLPEALSTYLHELSHKSGGDETAAFSYTLTDCQTAVIDFLLNADRLEIETIKKRWDFSKKQDINPTSSLSRIFSKIFQRKR